MAKMFTYVVIMSVMMFLLYFGGAMTKDQLGGVSDIVTTNSTTGAITLSSWDDIGIYKFLWAVGGVLAAAALVGVAASFFGGTTPGSSLLIAGEVFISGTFLLSFVTGMWNVITKVNGASCTSGICGNWVSAIVAIIVIPIAIGYIWSAFDWIVNGD